MCRLLHGYVAVLTLFCTLLLCAGYYMGMWLQFRNAGYQRGVYLSNGGHSASNHGVALLYSKGRLDVIFKMADGREWRTRSNNVLEQRWYHVAATWSQEKGLYLYINGVEAGHDETSTKRRSANENSRYNGFYIGRANDNSGLDRLGQVLVDDFTFMSTFKEAKDVRESGKVNTSLSVKLTTTTTTTAVPRHSYGHRFSPSSSSTLVHS